MKHKYLTCALITLFIAFVFTSCDKDDDSNKCEPSHSHGGGSGDSEVELEFEFKMGDEPFAYNTTYTLNGVAIEFSEIRFYLSDIMLHDDGGDTDMLDKTILVDVGGSSNSYSVGTSSFPHIHEIHMLLGLNDVVNHEDPTQAEAPLNDASMHWGWDPASGYKFIKTEATVDTDDDGVPDNAISIHCATDALSREMILEVHQDADSDHARIHLIADVSAFYTGADFLNLEGTHGDSDLTNLIADKVAATIDTE